MTVGAYVSVNTQLLPELVTLHAKSVGPLQSGGSVVLESPSPEIRRPSADVNATVIVCFAPGTTDTVPATDGIALTVSAGPGGVLPVLLVKPETPPPPPLPVAMAPVLATALPELDTSTLQPASSDSAEAPSSARWNDGMYPDSPDFTNFSATGSKVTSNAGSGLRGLVNRVTKPCRSLSSDKTQTPKVRA